MPAEVRGTLGESHAARVEALIADCVQTSAPAARGEHGLVALSAPVLSAIDVLREFMFARVYLIESTLRGARRGQRVVRALYRHFEAYPEQIAGWSLPDDPPWRRAADYVSGMTDGYAVRTAERLGLG